MLRVFYNKEQSLRASNPEHCSLDKPRRVVQAWRQCGLPVQMMRVKPLTPAQLSLAHDPKYVHGVLSGRIKNGFGNKDLRIARSLRWSAGSLVSAALYAHQSRTSVFSPTSGFHHAGYSHAAGFCTFSALTIAAILLKRQGGASRVGILDLDSHPGDGTEETLARTDSGGFVEHVSLGYASVDASNNAAWLEALPELIRERFSSCDVLLYQAGVDCHRDDPLVDQGHFTTSQLAERDRAVYTTCERLGLPVVTNLAGGYQRPFHKVLALHCQTAQIFHGTLRVR